MGDMVRRKISDEINKAGYFTLMADESRDYSKVEQLAIVFRYVDVDSGIIHEQFLTFVQADNLNANSLTACIRAIIDKYKFDHTKIVSQCYDGAAVMSGNCSGVQQQIQMFAPQAFYIHCYAHCLNLALVDCSKTVPLAWEFFTLIQTQYTFISTSKAHSVFVRVQKEHYPDKPVHQLQGLSDTRWACHQSAVPAICSTFDSLLATLEIL